MNLKERGRFWLLLGITLLVTAVSGCGDNQDEYVFTGTVAPPPQVGNVTFQFAAAQAVLPGGTTSFRFDFYDGDLLDFTATRDYAASVTIENVDIVVDRVVITAFDVNGIPIAITEQNLAVVPGGNLLVNLSGAVFTLVTYNDLLATPDPLALTVGQQGQLNLDGLFTAEIVVRFLVNSFAAQATFVSADPTIANVSATGVVQGLAVGNTTITSSYTVNGTTHSDDSVVVVTAPAQ